MSSSGRPRAWPVDAAAQPWTPAAFDLRPLASTEPDVPPTDPVADAYALGFAQGRQEGERAERARLGPAVRAAEEAIEAINQNDARWTGAVEENLVTLALAIARHIVDREIAVDPEVVGKLVRRGLEAFPIDQPVQVRVHPEDLEMIRALRAERPSAAFGRTDTTTHWVADGRITRGGCVVEGRERIVDGRIETALERIYRRMAHQHA